MNVIGALTASPHSLISVVLQMVKYMPIFLCCVQMMPQDTYSQAVKQYRDLLDTSLADTPVPEAPKPAQTEDVSEAPGHAAAGMQVNRNDIAIATLAGHLRRPSFL